MIEDMMLKKLKIAKEFTDKDVFIVITNHLDEDNDPRAMRELFNWYKDSGLSKNDGKKTIFRGLNFDYDDDVIKTMIFDRKLSIRDNSFESWTTYPYVAANFYNNKEIGIIISNEVDRGEYMEVNKIVSYIDSKGYSVNLSYQDECEILSPFCDNCTMDDLEVMYVHRDFIDKFLGDAKRGGWELDDKRTGR